MTNVSPSRENFYLSLHFHDISQCTAFQAFCIVENVSVINENVARSMEDFCDITELEGGLIKPWFASLDRT